MSTREHESSHGADGVPEFLLADLARAEESRLAAGFREIADRWVAFAGGVAALAERGSWANAAVGAGFAGAVSEGEIEAMIGVFEGHGVEPRVELCPYADASLTRGLAARGFVVRNFENVLYRDLMGPAVEAHRWAMPKGLTLRAIDRGDEREVDLHARVATGAFVPSDRPCPESVLETMRRCARHPRVTAVLAEINGEPVGAGSLEVHEKIAALFGAAVLPAARRMGVQRAMIDWRVEMAREAGCRWATIGSRPGIGTERNVRRAGFQMGYTKVFLVRPRVGLVAVDE